MTTLKFADILSLNHALGEELVGPDYKIGLISNITMGQLKEILEFSLRRAGVLANVITGQYDSIVQDSERLSSANAVLIFWEPGNFVDGICSNIDLMNPDELNTLAEKIESEIDFVFDNLKTTRLVLINKFSSALFDSDPLRDGKLRALCKRLNYVLEKKTNSNQIVVDLDIVLGAVGIDASVDFRQFSSSKALYSLAFLKAYAEAVRPAFLAANGCGKKIIVLDCDNTLWGGVLGEDGASGIRIGEETQKGKIFLEVQSLLLGFKKNGVLLALCSKNNQTDVDLIFAEHPTFLLREKDIVAKRINWQDKATNLREIAAELNIGLDSFVFIDDSAFELGLIEKELPQVQCIQVPERLSDYPSVIRKLGTTFFSFTKTNEDERKTQMYKEEFQRRDIASKYTSIEEYLASLGLRIEVFCNEKILVSRASQLSLKTNQFNLTTKRYTEADIHNMLADPLCFMSTFSVTDRYGQYGVTGMVVIFQNKSDPTSAIIDCFLMSCRVIGRNVEYAFLDEIFRILRAKGVKNVFGTYHATEKNSQVARLYDGLGFEIVSDTKDKRDYKIYLEEYKPRDFDYIKIDGMG